MKTYPLPKNVRGFTSIFELFPKGATADEIVESCRIPGSRYIRTWCCSCGEPGRAATLDAWVCENCEPQKQYRDTLTDRQRAGRAKVRFQAYEE